MDTNRRDELDSIIDRALAGYSTCEPLVGLEDRVLNRIHLANSGRRQPRWQWWALLIPALAALAAVVVVSRSNRAPVAQPVLTARVDRAPAAPPAPPAVAAVHTVSHVRPAKT